MNPDENSPAVDHKSEAERLLSQASNATREYQHALLAQAQVHATLALVEALRP